MKEVMVASLCFFADTAYPQEDLWLRICPFRSLSLWSLRIETSNTAPFIIFQDISQDQHCQRHSLQRNYPSHRQLGAG
jgi:hypothetical protein